MASAQRPQQWATRTCTDETGGTLVVHDFGFDAFSVVVTNDGPQRIFVNLGTTTSACSTGGGFVVNANESQEFSGMGMPLVMLTTTSTGNAYRVGAWRW